MSKVYDVSGRYVRSGKQRECWYSGLMTVKEVTNFSLIDMSAEQRMI